jgi:hypothetical protein
LSHLVSWRCFWGRFGGSIFSYSFVRGRCLSCSFFRCGSFGYLLLLVLDWAIFSRRLFRGILGTGLFLCGYVCNVICCCILGSYRFFWSVVFGRFRWRGGFLLRRRFRCRLFRSGLLLSRRFLGGGLFFSDGLLRFGWWIALFFSRSVRSWTILRVGFGRISFCRLGRWWVVLYGSSFFAVWIVCR